MLAEGLLALKLHAEHGHGQLSGAGHGGLVLRRADLADEPQVAQRPLLPADRVTGALLEAQLPAFGDADNLIPSRHYAEGEQVPARILLQRPCQNGPDPRIVRIVKMFRDRDKVNADVVNGH